MQRITDVLVQGESKHGFDSLVLKDETGAQYQLFVDAGQLSLVKLEPAEEAVPVDEAEDEDEAAADARVESLLQAFGELFGRCTNPNCGCQK